MAHLSYASPDHRWLLVVEMDPMWQPCRVVPMDGSSHGSGRLVPKENVLRRRGGRMGNGCISASRCKA